MDQKPINRIEDGRGGRGRATSFSPVTSTDVGVHPQNFLTFSFNSLPHWCKLSSLYLKSVPNY